MAFPWLPFAVFVALLSLLVSACQTAPTAPESASNDIGLVAQPAAVDLGTVPFDQQAHARFTLINQGTREVHLDPNVEVQKLEGC